MQLTLYPFELKFKHTFTISRKSKDVQPLLVVKLEQDGFSGLGETADNSYYNMTVPRLMEDINAHRDLIEGYTLDTPEELWKTLFPLFKDNLFALCAIDLAAHDLYAKKQGKKLYEVWGLDISHNPMTDYTIGIDTVENMVSKLKEFPWPIYKIKLGTKEDIAIIEALRKHTNAIFRVDANCAWGVEETLRNAAAFKSLGVEFIEQPMPAADIDGMKQVYEQSALPLIADESCITEADVALCKGLFHGINIKLTKCGGITPARRMIAEAKQLGMQVMTGSMNESTVGTSAVAHLLPYLDYVDMDGPLLLAEDTADGVKIVDGRIIYADRPGTGALLR
ncbi:dipeptide epimerase [Chitinophaga pinensis]|uniref:Dipeptide epimerase n=1 Tax=Chitinophaga pinensis (strain ATCC 43595 / DSM 2588 / LMG 13176 / NBRC 15968 / NCIMB 11800 / UQM 2034) TaxID=485918 RepID=A0A979GW32_CHIPD|nr:dipeptide epimerase [Chitinophaga pinensis]ACU63828.1 Mandelate racemase/muconate lactonizing protein [Chitinophaga pinensis DSM 2588]